MTDSKFLRHVLKFGPATWTGSTVDRVRDIIRGAFLRNGNAIGALPYTAGVYCAQFPETPLVVLPAPTPKAAKSFGSGYLWGTEPHHYVQLQFLAKTALYFLRRESGVQANPIPGSLKSEATLLKDSKGCVLFATALVTGLSYGTAYDFYAANGRHHGRGTHIRIILGREPKSMWGWRFTYHDPKKGENTFVAWLKRHPTGRHIVVVAHHAFAVIDGRPIDHSPISPRKRVQYWYTTTNEN